MDEQMLVIVGIEKDGQSRRCTISAVKRASADEADQAVAEALASASYMSDPVAYIAMLDGKIIVSVDNLPAAEEEAGEDIEESMQVFVTKVVSVLI